MNDEKHKSDLILEELQRLKEKERVVEVEEERIKLALFSLSGDLYAFRGEEVREILPWCEITWVPGAPQFIPGLINVRGDIESVLDVRYLLGLAEAGRPGGLIIIAEKSGIRSGIIADTIEDVVDLPISGIKPTIATLDGDVREFVAGELEYLTKNVTLLDIGRIFARLPS